MTGVKMDNKKFKDTLLTIRDIIRETLLGNAAIVTLLYAISFCLPAKDIADVIFIAFLALVVIFIFFWMMFIIFDYTESIIKKSSGFIFIIWFFCVHVNLLIKVYEIFTKKPVH
jgi:hypothetical protein